MLKTGLVSVTFRKMNVRDIVELVSESGLDGIEWGGDVHVPHGDLKKAREANKITEDSGLEVSSYGSYYWVGCENDFSFQETVDTAVELKTSVIRVWAGRLGSDEADQDYWSKVVDDSYRIADIAEEAGLSIAYEFHNNTLTDTNDSAVQLLKDVEEKEIGTYWQPLSSDVDYCRKGLERILPWLYNIHAYWLVDGERRPLAEGESAWKKYLEVIENCDQERYILLEFVKDDTRENFLKDAHTLLRWVNI